MYSKCRSLTPFEMTDQRDADFSHSLTLTMTARAFADFQYFRRGVAPRNRLKIRKQARQSSETKRINCLGSLADYVTHAAVSRSGMDPNKDVTILPIRGRTCGSHGGAGQRHGRRDVGDQSGRVSAAK